MFSLKRLGVLILFGLMAYVSINYVGASNSTDVNPPSAIVDETPIYASVPVEYDEVPMLVGIPSVESERSSVEDMTTLINSISSLAIGCKGKGQSSAVSTVSVADPVFQIPVSAVATVQAPHPCTCGCDKTGVCTCPSCNVGTGFAKQASEFSRALGVKTPDVVAVAAPVMQTVYVRQCGVDAFGQPTCRMVAMQVPINQTAGASYIVTSPSYGVSSCATGNCGGASFFGGSFGDSSGGCASGSCGSSASSGGVGGFFPNFRPFGGVFRRR